MLPNAWVILWNDQPVQVVNRFPIASYPMRVGNPGHVTYFPNKLAAQRCVDEWESQTPGKTFRMKLVEIQFRIMDKE